MITNPDATVAIELDLAIDAAEGLGSGSIGRLRQHDQIGTLGEHRLDTVGPVRDLRFHCRVKSHIGSNWSGAAVTQLTVTCRAKIPPIIRPSVGD